jgi:hypothetical protein
MEAKSSSSCSNGGRTGYPFSMPFVARGSIQVMSRRIQQEKSKSMLLNPYSISESILVLERQDPLQLRSLQTSWS